MPFSNLDYLYQHLPARFRRDDADLFLKRFLQFFGLTLDEWDQLHENFYQQIDPQTASEPFINFWLWALFGWSWYPRWFTLARKRQLYADFAQHLARRGTPKGVEGFLRAFSIYARHYREPQYWGQFVWGEADWTITGAVYPEKQETPYGPTWQGGGVDALANLVQVSHLADEVNFDVQAMTWSEMVWGEGYLRDTEATLTRKEIEDLIRFEWPNAQQMIVAYQVRRNVAGVEAWDSDELILNEDIVPDENSGPITGAN